MPPRGYWQRRKFGYSHEESLKSQAKIRKPFIPIPEDKIREIRKLFAQGVGCREIGRVLNICHTKISAITRGKRYTNIGLL